MSDPSTSQPTGSALTKEQEAAMGSSDPPPEAWGQQPAPPAYTPGTGQVAYVPGTVQPVAYVPGSVQPVAYVPGSAQPVTIMVSFECDLNQKVNYLLTSKVYVNNHHDFRLEALG